MRMMRAALTVAVPACLAFMACRGTESLSPVAPSTPQGMVQSITSGAGNQQCSAPKVAVCHRPPGNPSNAQSICVDDAAAQGHLNSHDDNRIEAELCGDGVDNDCDGDVDAADDDCGCPCFSDVSAAGTPPYQCWADFGGGPTIDNMWRLRVYPSPLIAHTAYQSSSTPTRNFCALGSNTITDITNDEWDACVAIIQTAQESGGCTVCFGDACPSSPAAEPASSTASPGGCGNDKVEMCHLPPGNRENDQRICISGNAQDAHLRHGDHLPFTAWPDADSDGFGDANASARTVCVIPTGWVEDDSDCNDGDAGINPNASETCDHVDNDCDSTVDEGDVCVSCPCWDVDLLNTRFTGSSPFLCGPQFGGTILWTSAGWAWATGNECWLNPGPFLQTSSEERAQCEADIVASQPWSQFGCPR